MNWRRCAPVAACRFDALLASPADVTAALLTRAGLVPEPEGFAALAAAAARVAGKAPGALPAPPAPDREAQPHLPDQPRQPDGAGEADALAAFRAAGERLLATAGI